MQNFDPTRFQHRSVLNLVAMACMGQCDVYRPDAVVAPGTQAFSGDQSMGGNQLTSVGTPAASDDAATKGYVDTAVAGGTTVTISSADSPYALAAGVGTVLVNLDGNITMTYPAKASNDKRIVKVKIKAQAGSNVLTIDPNSTETIDGASTRTMSVLYQAEIHQCDSTDGWYVF